MPSQIPTLDIRRFTHPTSAEDRQAFIDELGAAYREWGFAGIRNHGIPQAQIDQAYATFRELFALPEDTKRRYHVPGGGGARGYTAFGVETAKGAKYSDLKEFWHIGREIPADSPYRADMPDNLGRGNSAAAGVGYGLFQSLDALGSQGCPPGLHIGLPADYFADKTQPAIDPAPIHYPPITTDDIPKSAPARTRHQPITLLVGATRKARVLSRKGEWVLHGGRDTIVVNIGDICSG